MTTYSLIPWNGGQANVTAGNTERRSLPMTPLAKGCGPVRYSADGIYCYRRDEGAWFVQHVPSGVDLTEQSGLLIGFTSCANARRWTAAENPQPVESAGFHMAGAAAVLAMTTAHRTDTVRRAAEYQAQKLRDASLDEDDQDCDWCGPGQPCTCTADSTDPIENIYD